MSYFKDTVFAKVKTKLIFFSGNSANPTIWMIEKKNLSRQAFNWRY